MNTDTTPSGMPRGTDTLSPTRGKTDEAAARAGEGLESAAAMIRGQAKETGTIGTTATAIADRLEGAGSYLQEHGLSGALEDIEAVIRRYPIQSLLIGLGLGYMLSRTRVR